jgi:hypothetical protein
MSPPTAILAKGRTVCRESSTAAFSVSPACPARDRMIALDSVFHSGKTLLEQRSGFYLTFY